MFNTTSQLHWNWGCSMNQLKLYGLSTHTYILWIYLCLCVCVYTHTCVYICIRKDSWSAYEAIT